MNHDETIVNLWHLHEFLTNLAAAEPDGTDHKTNLEESMDTLVQAAAYVQMLKGLNTARLMTLADFEGNPDVDQDEFLPCWCETTKSYDEATCALLKFDEPTTFSGWTTIKRDELANKEKQEKGLRYWTKRPTREQMEATPWE